MANDRYDTARSDFEYLESLAPLDDQVELDSMRLDLMQRPTKAKAADMYETGIRLWFMEHGVSYNKDERVSSLFWDRP